MQKITTALQVLCQEAIDLGIGTQVIELTEIPNSLTFATQYLAKNQPVVIRGAVEHWSALQKWTPAYLQSKLANKRIHVAQTPNGYADGLAKNKAGVEFFVLPKETEMEMTDFLQLLSEQPQHTVTSIQHQNSNLSLQFPELLADIDLSSLEFASKCFDKPPDALNFWLGDERGITSMHKDPYENLYCVIKGHKDFVLIPPHQLPFIPRANFPVGVYKQSEVGDWEIEAVLSDNGEIMQQEWVAIDPINPDLARFPEFANCTPIHVRVNAGDLLYLPNYWYHHVRQNHGCMAVNFWYDMEYDSRYAYFCMLQALTNKD